MLWASIFLADVKYKYKQNQCVNAKSAIAEVLSIQAKHLIERRQGDIRERTTSRKELYCVISRPGKSLHFWL
jgi:hypothetical protein